MVRDENVDIRAKQRKINKIIISTARKYQRHYYKNSMKWENYLLVKEELRYGIFENYAEMKRGKKRREKVNLG